MASSPDPAPTGATEPERWAGGSDPSGEQVRWPLLAKIGVVVAVVTVVVCLGAAVYAAFFFEG